MEKIERDTLIFDVLKMNPESPDIFASFGMSCLGCPAARGESVEQAAQSHGIDVDQLLKALNA